MNLQLCQHMQPYPNRTSDVLPYREQRGLEAQGIFLWARVLGKLGSNAVPVAQNGDGILVHPTVARVHAWEVDLADEVDLGRLLGVVGAALHLELVDAVLVVSLSYACQKEGRGTV